MYSIAGKLISHIVTFSVKLFNRKVLKKKYQDSIVKREVLATSILCVVLIILIGCAITTRSYMENWNFSSSVYFWFISLTTIGYGDLHFDRDKHLRSIHLLLTSAALLLFGLGMVAAVIESFSLVMEKSSIDDADDESNSGSYIDFEDHNRVTCLVLSTVKCGAGVLMESLGEGEEIEVGDGFSRGRENTLREDILQSSFNDGTHTPHRERLSKRSRKRTSSNGNVSDTHRERPRRVSFIDQTMQIHSFSRNMNNGNNNKKYQELEEEDLTELDEINIL